MPIESLEHSAKLFQEKTHLNKDYHLLVLRDENNDGDIKFECFNSPHTEIEFQELKKQVLEIIKNNDKAEL